MNDNVTTAAKSRRPIASRPRTSGHRRTVHPAGHALWVARVLTVVVPAVTAGEPRLRIRIEPRGWLDGGRPVYHYQVIHWDGSGDVVVFDGDDLRGTATGRAPTLRAAALVLAGLLAAAGESLASRGEESEHWREYTPAQRDFLAATHPRFAALGDA